MDKSELPWVIKHRPQTIKDIKGHEQKIQLIKKLMENNFKGHLLLHGPPGTGKTSTALAIGRELHGAKSVSAVLQLNASDERGVDVVRNKIVNFVQTKALNKDVQSKLVILDECDAVTADAQNCLRRTMEQYSTNAKFILMCNHVHKIIHPIKSRCNPLRFLPLEKNAARQTLTQIAMAENLDVDEAALDALVDLAAGDMRVAIGILQNVKMAEGKVSVEGVYDCTGAPNPADLQLILESLLNDSTEASVDKICNLMDEKSIAFTDIVAGILDLWRKLDIPSTVKRNVVRHVVNQAAGMDGDFNESIQIWAFASIFELARKHLE